VVHDLREGTHLSGVKIWAMDGSEPVEIQNGTLMMGDVELPIVDGVLQEPDTMWWRLMRQAEQDLIAAVQEART
jgi:hypothetical protein